MATCSSPESLSPKPQLSANFVQLESQSTRLVASSAENVTESAVASLLESTPSLSLLPGRLEKSGPGANQAAPPSHYSPGSAASSLLSLAKSEFTPSDYFLLHPTYFGSSLESKNPSTAGVTLDLATSSISGQSPHSMGSSFISSLSHNVSTTSTTTSASETSARYGQASYTGSSSEESKYLNTMPTSSSSLNPYLASPFASPYEPAYHSLGRRSYLDSSGPSWAKSAYSASQVELASSESQSYLNPPPAHHNTASERYFASSVHYPISSSLSSSHLSASLSDPSCSSEGTSRKYRKGLAKLTQSTKDSEEYKLKRERNNIAVRKSREKAKRRLKENETRAQELMIDNEQLRNRIRILSKILHGLRVLLNTCGVSQEKINLEISKILESDSEPSPNLGVFAKQEFKSTGRFGDHTRF